MKDLVSVIIPAYNHEKYVQEAIQSIIEQTYQNIELIIIDDGSKDSTWQKINEKKEICEKRFLNVTFETQENQGTYTTLNRLLEKARGEYIYLIASDDIATPKAIELEWEFLSKNPDFALVVGENLVIDQNGTQCYWNEKRENVYSKDELVYSSFTDWLAKTTNQIDFYSNDFGSYESLLVCNYIPNGYLIRNNIFEKTGYFTKEAPLEDYWLMLQISKYAKMKYINEPTFYYRWHCENTISQRGKIAKNHKKTLNFEIKQVKASKDKKLKTLMKKYLANRHGKIIFKIPFIFEVYQRQENERKNRIIIVFLGLKLSVSKRR